MDTYTNPTTGVTYTRQGDGRWKGSNGSTVGQSAIDAMMRGTGSTQAERKTKTVKRADGSTVLIDSLTGAVISVVDPGPGPEQRKRDKNLGAGVFQESDTGSYYTFGPGGALDGEKRYLTDAEVKAITNPQAASGGGGGSSGAEWGNLAARQAELAEQIRTNRQAELMAQQTLDFNKQKEAFAQTQDDKRLTMEAHQQVINTQATVASLQMQQAGLMQQQANLQAQLQSQTDQFNASMGFETAKANQQAQAQKRSDLAQNARDIAGFSASPTDWGKLAAFETASRPWGTEDQGIQESGGFITDKSLQPLQQGLTNRDQLNASPDNPYSFSPITAPTVQMPQPLDLSFLSGFGMGGTGGGATGADPRLQGAGGIVDTDGRTGEFVQRPNGGDPLWVGPDPFATLPKKEHGGMVQGAFIAGDSSDGKENEEIIIPLEGGQTLIVPKKGKKGKGLPKYENGGVFDETLFGGSANTAQARQFQMQAAQRARIGTPWTTGALPGATFASSPGMSPEVADLLASMRGLEYGENADYFRRRANLLRPAAMQERAIGRTA